jgi:phage N-6-adenine-methyltransferase
MSFIARNHPQQVAARGALEDVDDRRTPPDLLAECMKLTGVRHFDLDVAASRQNALAADFFDARFSGLERGWWGRVWCNPPYSEIRPWVEKAEAEHRRGRTLAIVMLLPANRTEQGWWQDLIEPGRRSGELGVWFLRGRRRFDRPGWTPPAKGDRPPFGLCVIRWGGKGVDIVDNRPQME